MYHFPKTEGRLAKLVVIGGGPEEKKLKKLAGQNKNIIFAGRASDEDVRKHLYEAKALIFCAEEDFGLTPLEAQACGTPVIAFGKGGATETVLEGKTGLYHFPKTEGRLAVKLQLGMKNGFNKKAIS